MREVFGMDINWWWISNSSGTNDYYTWTSSNSNDPPFDEREPFPIDNITKQIKEKVGDLKDYDFKDLPRKEVKKWV